MICALLTLLASPAIAQPEREPPPAPSPEAEGEAGAEADAEADAESDSAAEAESEADAEAEADADAEADPETAAELVDDPDPADASPTPGGMGTLEDAESGPPEDAEDAEPEEEEEAEEGGLTFGGSLGGEYRHRVVFLSDFPLDPLPRTDPATTGRYGSNFWGEQWLRLHGELALRPVLRLYAETDLVWGVAYGDLAQGLDPAAWPRDDYGYPGLRLRQLYLEWRTPIGLLRVGQMAFSWGLGIISNGGNDPPVFGDYRYGDLVRRLLFATKPAGEDSPFTIAVAGDWVAWDLIADHDGRGDLAFQGLLAAFYEDDEDNQLGAYAAYRHQTNTLNDELSVFVGDVFAKLHFGEPSGGRIRVAFEAAYVRGTTTLTRTVTHPEQDVEQLLAVAQIGRVSPHLDLILEGGYASGDSNAEDGIQRRGTIDPDHRVGLILFPEVLAAQSARSANLARSPTLFGRPSRGTELLPTNGGVSNAYYFFPYAIWRPMDWIDVRLGGVVAWSSSDVVDPFAQRARSRSVNYRGGDPSRRDLGLELDGAVLLHGEISEGVTLSGGVEGGVLFPGAAFEDADGNRMDTVAMTRLRLGIRY
ncbi:MAG: hypothetical protein SangKO_024280 [Sandaracinaceae bacterium]